MLGDTSTFRDIPNFIGLFHKISSISRLEKGMVYILYSALFLTRIKVHNFINTYTNGGGSSPCHSTLP